MKNFVVYEKDSGTIKQVLFFRGREIKDFAELQLDKFYAPNTVDVIIYDGPINVKKDKVINGVYCIGSAEKNNSPFVEVNPTTESSEQILPVNRSHVALITTWRKQCGIAKYSEDLIRECKHKVTVFCEVDSNTENPPEGVNVIACWTNRDKNYNDLVTRIVDSGADVVHVQYNHDLMNAGALKEFGNRLKSKGIYTIMTLHSTKGGVHVYTDHFDHIITHSDISKLDLTNEGIDENRVSVIRIGSNEPLRDIPKEIICQKKDIDSTRPILAIFGFMFPQKGLLELLKTLLILKERYPTILLLVISSTKNIQNTNLAARYFEECTEFADKASLNDNVLFVTDFLPFKDIFDYLHCADLLVMPYVHSAAQATSSAGRTALASLRPVLATEVEIFDDLKGIIPQIQPNDNDTLANKITELLENEDERKAIVKRSRYFLQETSWKNIAKEHSYIYRPFSDIKIHIEGQVFSYFSASIVNRRLACGLDELGADVSLSSVNLAENKDYNLGDDSRKLLEKKQNTNICVRHFYPPKFSGIEADVKIMYLPVETTTAPNEWLEGIEKHADFVWVYSNHGKDAFTKLGVTKPVVVIKSGYDPNHFNPNIKPVDLSKIKDSYTGKFLDVNDNAFVFMFCGHAQERKNLNAIFEAYLQEFSSNENVLFVLKSYDGGEIHKLITDIQDKVSSTKSDIPKYLYIYEDTVPDMLSRYYASADCMVQCSKAEGFGLPIIEAMAMGIPSVVNLFGGPVDFCTEDNSFPVPFELVESSYHVQSKDKKSLWAENKISDIQNTLRHIFENPKEVKEKGRQAIRDSRSWTYRDAAYDVINFIRTYKLK